MSEQRQERQTAYAEVRRWHGAKGHAHLSVLRWHRCVGYARHDGVSVDMFEPPLIAPDAQDIEYLPHAATIDGVPMTPEQITLTRKTLAQMACAARDALAGQSTLVVVGA